MLLKEAIPLFVKQGKIHYEGCSRIILGQFYEFMYKSFMVQIKNFVLYNDELTDTISLLDKPLKVDFNRIPIYVSVLSILIYIERLDFACFPAFRKRIPINIQTFLEQLIYFIFIAYLIDKEVQYHRISQLMMDG